MKQTLTFFAFFLVSTTLLGQKLKPGFEKAEYIELMSVFARQVDTLPPDSPIPKPQRFKFVYRSPVVGLDNRCDLWTSADSVAVISIRGTTLDPVGWLENFYAAMVPAKGQLVLSNDYKFDYQLAEHPQAAVHIGWLIGTAFLAQNILPRLDSCIRAGVTNFYIMGHSQGGAIGYLMTSHLKQLQKQGKIPATIRFKTYCSAAPKPGNLFYAYEYEALTAGGWAFNVVNSADWVPETPITIQTIDDFNQTNPFSNIPALLKKQKFPRNLALKYVFNKLSKPARKAQKNYQKYLGSFASRYVKTNLKEYIPPTFYQSSHYVRTGSFVVLLADEAYHKKYPDNKKTIFVHHLLGPYLYLASKLP
ncbi:lipase family protein [Spirosoma sp. RP8]|uniref:Lipase family protein n=1 Tax=Spirosoma liriopis TaxID=2937440 RepID=A0ABT0HGH9_9BACT|nr:lipase family protein [Spirosoma liriopis]MCK8491262.1 lipase family protein [Spirosoma liriopis]